MSQTQPGLTDSARLPLDTKSLIEWLDSHYPDTPLDLSDFTTEESRLRRAQLIGERALINNLKVLFERQQRG